MNAAFANQNKNEFVYRSLLDAIRRGVHPTGSRLPSERELADQYSCSRITIRHALERLEEKQVIRRLQGNGTFVNGVDPCPSADFRVGLILDSEEDELYNDPWLSELLYGMISAGGRQPFVISLIPVSRTGTVMETLAKRGQELHDYNGFVAARNLSAEEIETLCTLDLPFVLLQNEKLKGSHSYISIDNAQGAYLAAAHLLAIGCRHLFFMLPEQLPQYQDRVKGFQQALREKGMPSGEEDFVLRVGVDDCADAERHIENLLARKIPLDGLLLGSDGCTYSAVTTLRKHGIRIPEDVSVVMWDDFPWVSKVLRLPLTVVRQPFREQIVSAIEILMSQRGSYKPSSIQRIIQPTLIVRCSCRTPNNN